MSFKRRLRTVACCTILEGAALLGVPMRPEHVQDLMRSLNEQKLAHTTPEDAYRGDGKSPWQKGGRVSSRATGSFEVKMAPQGEGDTVEGIALARFSLNKQFHGDLEAQSVGEMLSSGLESNGSAAYVAIERVVGTLKGRRGSFVLMHNGTMTRDSQHLTVTVVPESGTGALAGLAGTLVIKIVEKKHLYEFDYSLPEGR